MVENASCPFAIVYSDQTEFDDCSTSGWDLTRENWNAHHTDDSIQVFIAGGQDSGYHWWRGWNSFRTLTFSEDLLLQLLDISFDCSLKEPCNAVFDCADIHEPSFFRKSREPFRPS